jgi:hypothetical protein
MDLTQKLNSVADIMCITQPTCMEVDKHYSIMRVFKHLQYIGFIIILALRADDGESHGTCVLNHTYSMAFDDNDILKINLRSERYKIKIKKKTQNCGPDCHLLEIQKH